VVEGAWKVLGRYLEGTWKVLECSLKVVEGGGGCLEDTEFIMKLRTRAMVPLHGCEGLGILHFDEAARTTLCYCRGKRSHIVNGNSDISRGEEMARLPALPVRV
jgi:hypothetical protein